MERTGPLWAYWCWIMERFCSRLLRSVSSRKLPHASLNRRVLEIGTITAIRNMYDLHDTLPTRNPMRAPKPDNAITIPGYSVQPIRPSHVLDLDSTTELKALHARIVVYLATQWDTRTTEVARLVPKVITHYSRLRIDDGDTIRAASTAESGQRLGRRDDTFIEYELRVDQFAHDQDVRPDFGTEIFFGQLRQIFTIHLTPANGLPLTRPTTLLLLDVAPCNTQQDMYGFFEYSRFRGHEVISAQQVHGLVGR